MGFRIALFFLVPSLAQCFRLAPNVHMCRSSSVHRSRSRSNKGFGESRSSPFLSRSAATPRCTPAASDPRHRAPLEWEPRLVAASDATTSTNPRQRVSRALNRALGNILATGDIFGSVSRSVSDDNAFGRHLSSQIGEGANGAGGDEDEDEDDVGNETQHARDVEDLFEGGGRLSLRKFGQKRRKSSANRLLRARTEASAAVVVDGPFSKLQEYMTLPVSEYSLLDSSLIRRVSDTSFRFQVPLKHFVGLDFTPTMEVEVELDSQAKAVVFRSVRSTLYGNVDEPGQAYTDPWPEAASSKIEYFRVAFDARLRWVDGDASLAPRNRGKGGFAGGFARRPRPAPPREMPATAAAEAEAEAAVGTAWRTEDNSDSGGGASARASVAASVAAAAGEAEAEWSTQKELQGKTEPATMFCDTVVKVEVILPPPYNALLPWRLVRALLGKVLSTTVAYVLPRFLELLADDFYGWQSGTRRAAATANETNRTLLGAKGGDGSGSGSGTGSSPSVAQEVTSGAGEAVVASDVGEGDENASWRGGSNKNGNSMGSNNGNNYKRNPVVGGLRRLRNVRRPGGERTRSRVAAAATDRAADVATLMQSPSATLQPTGNASANGGLAAGERFADWGALSASSGSMSGKDFNFEVSVDDSEEEREGSEKRQQRRWRRGRMGSGAQSSAGDCDGGGGGSGESRGGGPINWWG